MKDRLTICGECFANAFVFISSLGEVTRTGHLKRNEHFDDEPQSTNGVINTIIDATKNQKTNIYEVK